MVGTYYINHLPQREHNITPFSLPWESSFIYATYVGAPAKARIRSTPFSEYDRLSGHIPHNQSSSCCRVFIDPRGSLVISVAVKGDQGRYQCSAKNLAATRDTRPVRLRIHGMKILSTLLKLRFFSHPSNVGSLNKIKYERRGLN